MNHNDGANEKEPKVVVPYGYIPYCPQDDDEIDLKELWATLKRRKKVIFKTAGAFFALALVYLMIASPKYETKATLEIGKVLMKGKDGATFEKYFDNAHSLKEYLDVKYDTAGKYREKNAKAYIESVTIPKKENTFITISALGLDNNTSIKVLKTALDDVLSKHRAYYETIVAKKRDDIETIKKQIDYHLKIELPRLKKNLELLRSVEQKKIEDKIKLVQNIDIQKIEDKINFYKNLKIPAIRKKIEENRKEIVQKQASIEKMMSTLKKVAEKDPAMATMTAMQIATLQNDIARLNMLNIDYESEIKKIEEETIPDLLNQKERIVKQTLFNLQAEKRRLLEEKIPAQKARIEKLLNITIPKLKNQLKQIEISMKPPYLTKTKIVGRIYTHDHPVKPKKKLILAVALFTGLMLGVFLAFFLEFLQKEDRKENE